MHFQIRWARALVIASGLTLLVAGTMPATASAKGSKNSTCRSARCAIGSVKARRAAVSAPSNAKAAGQSPGLTLIFGSGDTADAGPPLNINPTEPLTNLGNMLANAGYPVDVDESSTLPTSIKPYRSIWYISTNPLLPGDQSKLKTFVEDGGALYLTGAGPGPCCVSLNNADGLVIDALVSGGVQVGNQGYPDDGSEPEAVNASAVDDVASIPNTLTSWTPSEPGGMSGVLPSNQLTTTTFTGATAPTGAVWDGSSMLSGKGRLAILMDITWLESEFWNESTATQMAVNIERFLMSALPVPAVANAHWAGFAAKAQGVRDVNGEWTVPTVDCSQDSKSSAVRIWVGIDGFGNHDLANAGVGVTCASASASPCYYLFTEVHSSHETPITGCGGVAPGDDVSVDVADQLFGVSTFVATIKVNGTVVDGQSFTLSESSASDSSAECVVEMPHGPVGATTPEHYKQLADFTQPVSFTDCAATASPNAGNTLDSEQLATGSDGSFSVDALNMGGNANPLANTTAPIYPALTWSVNWLRD